MNIFTSQKQEILENRVGYSMTEHYTVHMPVGTLQGHPLERPINTSMGSYNNDSIKRNITTEINSKVLLKQVYLNCTLLCA